MHHPIRLFIGIVLIALGVLGVWTTSQPSQPTQVDIPPAELPDPTPTPIPATLTNAFWQATLIGDQVALSEAPVTLVFTAEGNLVGSDGCNTFQTEYQTSEPSTISVAEGFSAGQKSCSDDLQAQADQFLSFLNQVNQFEILESNLKLAVDRQVVIIMTARTDPLIGNWQVETMLDAQSQLAPILPATGLTMEFTPEHTVFGSSGCNTYTAEYTNLGHQLTINQPAATLMFCETPTGIANQEQQFMTNISQVTGYQVSANQLLLTGADGQTIISLVSKPIPGGLAPLVK